MMGAAPNLPAPDLVGRVLERDAQKVVKICHVFGRVARLGGMSLEDQRKLNRGHANNEIERSSVCQQDAHVKDDRINEASLYPAFVSAR
jgi:hypothetical protein